MDRGLPKPQFRLQKGHAFFLLDLVIAALIFVGVGHWYLNRYGTATREAKDKIRLSTEAASQRALDQADSVMTARRALLAASLADSVKKLDELQSKRQLLGDTIKDRERVGQTVIALSEEVHEMMAKSDQSVAREADYEQNVDDRTKMLAGLGDDAQRTDSLLSASRDMRVEAASKLTEAKATRTFEPAGVLPDRTGLALSQEVGTSRLTDVELQQVLRNAPAYDLGIGLGVGLGTGDRASSKELGLLLSHTLIHRKLGLDLGAGVSYLSDEDGNGDAGPYASASVRYSPWYQERLHLNFGAQAGHGDVKPFIGLGFGRR